MKKLLVCLDGSPRETSVLHAAIALARNSGAKLLLFRSFGIPAELPVEAYSMAVDDVPMLLQKHARSSMEALEKTVPPELRDGIKVELGVPWQSIERAAADEDVDLIVIGSHGYQALDRVVGTTAAEVVNHADR